MNTFPGLWLSDTGHSLGSFCELAHARREVDGTWLGPQLGLLVTTPTLSRGLFTQAFVCVYVARGGGGSLLLCKLGSRVSTP